MQPRGGRVWPWAFPVVAGLGSLGLAKGAAGPLVLALDVACVAVGLIGTAALFQLGSAGGAAGPRCGGCGKPAPRVRAPANRRQMLWGGWTCTKCGAEVDRRGRVLDG